MGILIVDDHEEQRDLLATILQSAGYGPIDVGAELDLAVRLGESSLEPSAASVHRPCADTG